MILVMNYVNITLYLSRTEITFDEPELTCSTPLAPYALTLTAPTLQVETDESAASLGLDAPTLEVIGP